MKRELRLPIYLGTEQRVRTVLFDIVLSLNLHAILLLLFSSCGVSYLLQFLARDSIYT